MFFLGEALVLVIFTMGIVTLSKSSILQRLYFSGSGKTCKHSDDQGNASFRYSQVVHKKPYELPPLKLGASTNMTMGLRRLDHINWLTVDENYLPEHEIRSLLLSNHASSVLQCLPGSESACHEVLSVVSSFLASRYPSAFRFSGYGSKRLIHNLKTGESFPVVDNSHPLEAAARLAMEDFNLLVKDPSNGDYRLQASVTCFPAGWKLEDRIGYTLADLHGPVPAWKNRLCPSVNRYFDHLSPSTAMERHTLFVQMTPILFQDEALCSSSSISNHNANYDTTAPGEIKDGGEFHDSQSNHIPTPKTAQESGGNPVPKRPLPSEIHIRRERQTFTRLPTSNNILFTVRTYMAPLTSLGDKELAAFIEQAKHWGDDVAAYKGREKWWDTVLEYHEARKCGSVKEN